MLSEPAAVISREDGALCLRTSRQATCSGCSLKSVCGQYLFMRRDEQLLLSAHEVDVPEQLRGAGQVRVQLSARRLLLLVALFYALPLLALLTATLLALLAGAGEGGIMLAAAVGLLGGFGLARVLLRSARLRTRMRAQVVPAHVDQAQSDQVIVPSIQPAAAEAASATARSGP